MARTGNETRGIRERVTPLSEQQITEYLERIGCPVTPEPPTLNYLGRLIVAHQQTVPFENISVLLGDPISLDKEDLFQKIVTQRRGGYCFECNGMFGHLLNALGFESRPLAARVWYRAREDVSARTHTLNLVVAEGRKRLVDVGFGGTTPRIAIPLVPGTYEDQDGPIELVQNAEHGWMFSRREDGTLRPQFSFTLDLVYPSDLVVANHFMSTHPASHFTHGLRLSRFTPTGRIGLTGDGLTIRDGQSVQHQMPGEIGDCLNKLFGLSIEDRLDELRSTLMKLGES